jgi:hypothetical protein
MVRWHAKRLQRLLLGAYRETRGPEPHFLGSDHLAIQGDDVAGGVPVDGVDWKARPRASQPRRCARYLRLEGAYEVGIQCRFPSQKFG